MGQASSTIITNPKQCFTKNKVFGFAPFGEVNWAVVGSASVLAGLLSILTSVAGLPEVKETTDEIE